LLVIRKEYINDVRSHERQMYICVGYYRVLNKLLINAIGDNNNAD